MRAQDMFDICYERYRGMRDSLAGRPLAAASGRLDRPSAEYQWRPSHARAAEYLTDFELAGRRVLGRPQWAGRRRLFEIYFLHGVEYRRAIALVGVAVGTFDWWTQEVKKIVGKELARAGLFPPGKYFRASGAEPAAVRNELSHDFSHDETRSENAAVEALAGPR